MPTVISPERVATFSGARQFRQLVNFARECALERRPFADAEEAAEGLSWSTGPAGKRASLALEGAQRAAYRRGQIDIARDAVAAFFADNPEGDIECACIAAACATEAPDGDWSTLIRPADIVDLISQHIEIADLENAEYVAEQALSDFHTGWPEPTPESEKARADSVAEVEAHLARLANAPDPFDPAQRPPLPPADQPEPADLTAQIVKLEHAAAEAGESHLAAALKRARIGMDGPPPDADAPEPEAICADDRLSDLCSPPGLVGDIIDWMEASSDRPNRALLLGAALTFVGTLAGRKFATPSNLRSNNYLVTLAPSGHGKDHAIGRIKTLSAAAELDRYVGPARIMSASALRRLVEREPSVGSYIDEFGGFMAQIHDRRAGLHNAMIRHDLLEMFSAAGTFFAGAEYAGEAATKVFAPNLSLSGTSTPEAFWSSLSSLSASDGLLARLILLDVDGPKPKRVRPHLSPHEVPQSLIEAVRKLADTGGNLSVMSSINPSPVTVPFDFEAEDLDERRITELDAAQEDASPEAMPFLNRVREHALKLALVVAVGCDPNEPVITGPVLDWGYRLARLSAAMLIRESADRIADNERGEAVNRILRMIRNAGDKGVTPGRIADKQRGIDARLREQILHDLISAGRITLDRQAGTGGRARERYVAT